MKKHIIVINLFVLSYILIVALIFLTIHIVSNYYTDKQNLNSTIPSQLTITPMPKNPLLVHSAIPYWEQKKAVEAFKNNVEKYNSISMFWYYVNSDLEIAPYADAFEDESIITYAHEHNVKVLALITNLPDAEGTTWSSERIEPLIKTKLARTQHINDLIKLMDAKNFDGINIDYEELDTDLKNEFSDFIKELAEALHQRGKLLGVALHPKSAEGIPIEDNGSRAQDWKTIGEYADQLYIMSYGEHWDTSEAGPPASIPWDTKIVNYAKQLIPIEKIFLGIPLYGVRWEVGEKDGEGYIYTEVQALIEKYNIQPTWDEQSQSPYIRYSENGTNYELWFENAKSVEAKLNLARENNLGGITFWHIGGADPEIWSKL